MLTNRSNTTCRRSDLGREIAGPWTIHLLIFFRNDKSENVAILSPFGVAQDGRREGSSKAIREQARSYPRMETSETTSLRIAQQLSNLVVTKRKILPLFQLAMPNMHKFVI